MLSNHLILCHPLLLFLSIFPSIRVFSNELALPDGGGLIAKLCPTVVTLWTTALQAPLSKGVSRQEYRSGLPGDLPNPGIKPSSPVLQADSLLTELQGKLPGSSHHMSKQWSFCNNPSNEYSGLISFKIDWLYLLAIQGTLKSLLQHHSSKASVRV